MLASDRYYEAETVDMIYSRSLPGRRLVGMVRERMTLRQQQALLALDPDGRPTKIEPRHKRFLMELRRMRIDHHVIAELVLPDGGDRWLATSLGRTVRERLERDPI